MTDLEKRAIAALCRLQVQYVGWHARRVMDLNRDSQIEMFTNAGHAASIFAKQPDLEPDIVIWFISNLPLGGYGLPPAIK